MPEAGGHSPQQVRSELGHDMEQAERRPSSEHGQSQGVGGDDGRGVAGTREHPRLAEGVAGSEHRGGAAVFHHGGAALHDHVEVVTRVALADDLGTGVDVDDLDRGGDPEEVAAPQPREEGDPRQLVEELGARLPSHVTTVRDAPPPTHRNYGGSRSDSGGNREPDHSGMPRAERDP